MTVLTAIAPLAFLLTLSAAQNTTCYWANGQAASSDHLQPCQASLGSDGIFACCPPDTASDLYPLDYPMCTENGLCKAGNSDFLARGGCTDPTFASASCPSFCMANDDTNGIKDSQSAGSGYGMAGVTNCGADDNSGFLCCDADHDSGDCACNPAAGSAFMLGQGTFPIFIANNNNGGGSGGSNSSSNGTAVAGGNVTASMLGNGSATSAPVSTAAGSANATSIVPLIPSTQAATTSAPPASSSASSPPASGSAPASTSASAASATRSSAAAPLLAGQDRLGGSALALVAIAFAML